MTVPYTVKSALLPGCRQRCSLMPVNRQKNRAEGGDAGQEDEKLHHLEHCMAEDGCLC